MVPTNTTWEREESCMAGTELHSCQQEQKASPFDKVIRLTRSHLVGESGED